jgi:hypothetical protein
MNVFRKLRNFRTDTTGAVTVDWVVLTAAIVGLGIAVIVAFASNLSVVTSAIDDDIADASNFAENAIAGLND